MTTSVYRRAGQCELLVAEGMNSHSQLFDKLCAYRNACAFDERATVGAQSAKSPYELDTLGRVELVADAATSLRFLQPKLTLLLLANLDNAILSLRQASCDGMQFVLDQLGCGVGTLHATIVERLLSTYPQPQPMTSTVQENPMSLGTAPAWRCATDDYQCKDLPSVVHGGFPRSSAAWQSSALSDSYNRLLETCYSLLPHLSVTHITALLPVLEARLVQPNTP
jgi:hypothetical protein